MDGQQGLGDGLSKDAVVRCAPAIVGNFLSRGIIIYRRRPPSPRIATCGFEESHKRAFFSRTFFVAGILLPCSYVSFSEDLSTIRFSVSQEVLRLCEVRLLPSKVLVEPFISAVRKYKFRIC